MIACRIGGGGHPRSAGDRTWGRADPSRRKELRRGDPPDAGSGGKTGREDPDGKTGPRTPRALARCQGAQTRQGADGVNEGTAASLPRLCRRALAPVELGREACGASVCKYV